MMPARKKEAKSQEKQEKEKSQRGQAKKKTQAKKKEKVGAKAKGQKKAEARKTQRKENTESMKRAATRIPKVETQIEGLDDILQGGFPAGKTTIVAGGPGTGKTLLGLEFVYRGAVSGAPGIFLAFEETAGDMRQNALTFGWDLLPLEEAGKLFLMEGHIDPHVLLSGDYTLKGLLAIIEGKAKQMGAQRIAIDALDVLMRFFDDSKREQNEIFALQNWLEAQGMTGVFTTKKEMNASSRHDFLDFMADCVIHLDQRIEAQVTTRRLRVIKYRGSGYGANEYPFLISEDGLHFEPISDTELHYEPGLRRISSGHPTLDGILGGGYQEGTCILISGLTGTGKTCMGSTFLRSVCEQGQKALCVNYEESLQAMVAGMLSLGIDLRPAIESDNLEVMTIMSEAMGIEQHLYRILTAIRRFQPRHLVMDAISALKRIAGEKAAFDFVMRLVDACRKEGLTTVLVNQARGASEDHEFSGIGISSIIDTVITLHYKDTGEEIGRCLVVRKSRGSRHSNKYHDYLLTDQGIRIEVDLA
jgi:circadian clock protein KaiC